VKTKEKKTKKKLSSLRIPPVSYIKIVTSYSAKTPKTYSSICSRISILNTNTCTTKNNRIESEIPKKELFRMRASSLIILTLCLWLVAKTEGLSILNAKYSAVSVSVGDEGLQGESGYSVVVSPIA
jgi:hypothetical protein